MKRGKSNKAFPIIFLKVNGIKMDLLEFKDIKTIPDIIHPYTETLKRNNIPIIIDNGSYQCRVGWATDDNPLLLFKNLIAKPRKERSKKDTIEIIQTPQLQVGNDITNIEAVRFQLKTQFDKNVVTHFEVQEHLLDYAFTHLGIDSEGSVDHPIVMTEAFLNPNTSRQLMAELLFECYSVPGVAYGIDSLFAYHYTQDEPKGDALIVSIGYHTIHVIPVLNNKTIFQHTRRMNIGGYHVISFLHRILQLKYPAHVNAITLSRAEELINSICLVALNYKEELNQWLDPDYYEQNTKRIQLPYSASIAASALSLEQQRERKRELAKRLSEINARKREERLVEDEGKLQKLLEIQEMYELDDLDEIETALNEYQLKNIDDLNKNIVQLQMRIEKTKQKIIASNNAEDIIEEPAIKQQKLSKLNFESDKALHVYLQNLKRIRQEILNKKMSRKQRKQDMAKRRTAAGQERMRIISQLARKEKGNDDFGIRDEDWDIYKTISRDGGDSDSEAENEKLLELEETLKAYEPSEEDAIMTPGESHQLHVGIERYRAPELLFIPSMIGSSEAGLSEIIDYVIKLFTEEDRLKLASNVIVMGGMASLSGLKERLLADLISVRPFQSYCNVNILNDLNLAAWHGIKKWANQPNFKEYLITKEDYNEMGGEYFKQHLASNLFYPMPKEEIVDAEKLSQS